MTVRIRPRPVERVYEGWRFATFEAGAAALRTLAQDGPRPTVLRLSDETETLIGLAQPDAIGGSGPDGAPAGCMAIVGFEGTPEDNASRQQQARTVLETCGGELVGTEPGERWAHGRYSAPTCGTPCWTPARSPRRWRPPPSGPASPRSTTRSAPPSTRP